MIFDDVDEENLQNIDNEEIFSYLLFSDKPKEKFKINSEIANDSILLFEFIFDEDFFRI